MNLEKKIFSTDYRVKLYLSSKEMYLDGSSSLDIVLLFLSF